MLYKYITRHSFKLHAEFMRPIAYIYTIATLSDSIQFSLKTNGCSAN